MDQSRDKRIETQTMLWTRARRDFSSLKWASTSKVGRKLRAANDQIELAREFVSFLKFKLLERKRHLSQSLNVGTAMAKQQKTIQIPMDSLVKSPQN